MIGAVGGLFVNNVHGIHRVFATPSFITVHMGDTLLLLGDNGNRYGLDHVLLFNIRLGLVIEMTAGGLHQHCTMLA